MTKIKSIAFRNMDNQEFCEIHKKFANDTAHIKNPELLTLVSEYRRAVRELSFEVSCGFLCSEPGGARAKCVAAFTQVTKGCCELAPDDPSCHQFVELANDEIDRHKTLHHLEKIQKVV